MIEFIFCQSLWYNKFVIDIDFMPTNLLDPMGGDEKLSEEGLKFGYWLVTHQILLKKILAGVLIAAAGVLWIYSAAGFIDWAFVSGPKERANLNTILQIKVSPEALRAIAARDISFTDAEIFSSGVGRYDLLAQVSNPNEKWWTEFEYRFAGEGLDDGWKKGFALPGDKKYIVDLGVERAFRPRNVRLEINNLKYHRIDPHAIPNYAVWRDEHFNMAITDKKFNPNAIHNNKSIGVLSFKATNNTAYGYWSVGFIATLYRGNQMVSINYLSANDMASGEARDLQMSFYEGLPTITKYEVVPEFNIFDESGYISQK